MIPKRLPSDIHPRPLSPRARAIGLALSNHQDHEHSKSTLAPETNNNAMTRLINTEVIKAQAIDMALEAADGGVDALDAYARLRKLRDDLEECMELCKDAAMQELSKYGKEAVTKHGYRITRQNTPMQYGYGTEITELEKELKDKKEIARMALRKGGPMPYPPTSEVINPATITAGGGETIVMTRIRT